MAKRQVFICQDTSEFLKQLKTKKEIHKENTRFPVVCHPMEARWSEHRLEACLLASLPLTEGIKQKSCVKQNQTWPRTRLNPDNERQMVRNRRWIMNSNSYILQLFTPGAVNNRPGGKRFDLCISQAAEVIQPQWMREKLRDESIKKTKGSLLIMFGRKTSLQIWLSK